MRRASCLDSRHVDTAGGWRTTLSFRPHARFLFVRVCRMRYQGQCTLATQVCFETWTFTFDSKSGIGDVICQEHASASCSTRKSSVDTLDIQSVVFTAAICIKNISFVTPYTSHCATLNGTTSGWPTNWTTIGFTEPYPCNVTHRGG
jgi:hypothetical protein